MLCAEREREYFVLKSSIYYFSLVAEFPQHVMQAIIELQPDKREMLLNIVSLLDIN